MARTLRGSKTRLSKMSTPDYQKIHATKMSRTFDTICSIKIISGNTNRKLDHTRLMLNQITSLGGIATLSSANYAYSGQKTELTTNLLKQEKPDKWYGIYKEQIMLMKPEIYFRNYNILPILDTYITPDKETYFVTIDSSKTKYTQKIINYRYLPAQKMYYILNVKENKCSCPSFYWNTSCKHMDLAKEEKKQIKIEMMKVMSKKFGNGTIADQICSACDF